MNIQEAKQIKIADYLQSLGYSPVKQQGNCLWYKSPFRQETEASFKVNTDRNLWFDYGLGRGGNIIALAGVLYASDHVPYLLGKIAEQAPHIRPISFSFRQQASEPSWQRRNVKSSTSPITASPISPSVFRMWREDLKCVTVFSKAVSHPKTSAIFGNREKRERNALYSRA